MLSKDPDEVLRDIRRIEVVADILTIPVRHDTVVRLRCTGDKEKAWIATYTVGTLKV